MSYNSNDLKADISTVIASVNAKSLPIGGYTKSKLSKFFGEEVYKNTTFWKMIEPVLTDKTKDDITKISKKVSKNIYFVNKMHLKVAYNFDYKFSDEELRCIVEAIIYYRKFESKKYSDIRRFMHLFIKRYGHNFYLKDLQYFKSRISRTSVIEFEIYMDLIVELMEENDPKHIFKLIKTIVHNYVYSRFPTPTTPDQN